MHHLKKVVCDANTHIIVQLNKASSMHEVFASVLLMPNQKLSIPRLTVAAERAMHADMKKLEIRSAEQRATIFKNTISTPEAGEHHTPNHTARAVVEFDCKDQGRMYAIVKDGERYPDATTAARVIGIQNLVSLREGASKSELWDAYLKSTESSTSASQHVFALPVTMVWPLARPHNLINLGEALVYAHRLPDHFLQIDKTVTLALAHSMWSDVFILGK